VKAQLAQDVDVLVIRFCQATIWPTAANARQATVGPQAGRAEAETQWQRIAPQEGSARSAQPSKGILRCGQLGGDQVPCGRRRCNRGLGIYLVLTLMEESLTIYLKVIFDRVHRYLGFR
jgi:hypothetical protein